MTAWRRWAISRLAMSAPYSTELFLNSGVSGVFRYFGPSSSSPRLQAPKAITASAKLQLCIRGANLMTSPPSAQEKQYHSPRAGVTLKDGVFSSWNGHRPLSEPPPALRSCRRYGRTVAKVGRWFPSSQICSMCGVKDGPKPLDIREWAYALCGSIHDRDVNAACNIRLEVRKVAA